MTGDAADQGPLKPVANTVSQQLSRGSDKSLPHVLACRCNNSGCTLSLSHSLFLDKAEKQGQESNIGLLFF